MLWFFLLSSSYLTSCTGHPLFLLTWCARVILLFLPVVHISCTPVYTLYLCGGMDSLCYHRDDSCVQQLWILNARRSCLYPTRDHKRRAKARTHAHAHIHIHIQVMPHIKCLIAREIITEALPSCRLRLVANEISLLQWKPYPHCLYGEIVSLIAHDNCLLHTPQMECMFLKVRQQNLFQSIDAQVVSIIFTWHVGLVVYLMFTRYMMVTTSPCPLFNSLMAIVYTWNISY